MKAMNQTLLTRLRLEQLEERLVLSAATPTISDLPSEITIYQGESYHYGADDLTSVALDTASTAQVASLPTGTLVSIDYTVTDSDGVSTSLGTIVLQLFESESPLSTARFLELVDAGYYDGSGSSLGVGNRVHRIVDGFVVQAGSSDNYGYQGSSLGNLAFEYSSLLSHSSMGVVAMANTSFGTDTSNAQFYITDASARFLDGGYSIIGFVVSGYDVLEQLSSLETTTVTSSYGTSVANYPVDTVTMSNVTVLSTTGQSVLRLAATDDSAVGTSQLVLNVTDAAGQVTQKSVTVHVLARQTLTFPIDPDDYMDLTVASGSSTKINLPEYYSGSSLVQYTVTGYDSFPMGEEDPTWDLDGVTWTLNSRELTVTADASVAQRCVLKITASVYSSSTNTYVEKESYFLNVFVTPESPTLSLTQGGTTVTATTPTAGNFTLVLEDVNEFTTLYLQVNRGDEKLDTLILRKDGSDTKDENVSIVSEVLDSGLYRVSVTVTAAALREYAVDIDSSWTFLAWQEVPLSSVSDYDDLVSDPVSQTVLVDSEALTFEDADTNGFVLGSGDGDLAFGELFSLNLVTNRSDSAVYGVTMAFKEGTVVPSGMTLVQDASDTGGGAWALQWTPNEETHSGNLYLNVTVVATDVRGETAERVLSFDLIPEEMPDFSINYSVPGGTGVAGTTVDVEEGSAGIFYLVVPGMADGTVTPADYTAKIRVVNQTTGDVWSEESLAAFDEEGILRWQFEASDDESPYTYSCEMTLTRTADNATSKRSFLLNVIEVNQSPEITFVPDDCYSAEIGTAYTWNITFTDDVPTQSLVWSLSGNVPTGMTISDTVHTGEDGSRYVVVSWTPVAADAETDFAVTVTVTDPDGEQDSLAMAFRTGVAPVTPVDPEDPEDPVDPEGPKDDLSVLTPDPIPTITNWQDYRSVWNTVVNQRLSALVDSLARFITSYSQAATVERQSIESARSDYQNGTTDLVGLTAAVTQATSTRQSTQLKNLSNFQTRQETIKANTLNAADELNASAESLGLATNDRSAIMTLDPLILSRDQMRSIWQNSFYLNSAFLVSLIVSPTAADAVFAGDFSEIL